MDLSHKTIKELFYKQIKDVTMRNCSIDSFDFQFSDRWLN